MNRQVVGLLSWPSNKQNSLIHSFCYSIQIHVMYLIRCIEWYGTCMSKIQIYYCHSLNMIACLASNLVLCLQQKCSSKVQDFQLQTESTTLSF